MGAAVPDFQRFAKAEGPLLQYMRREVAAFLNRNSINFPGAQPVSFARKHFENLLQDDYYLCEKSDGVRCLLYTSENDDGTELHYLIDRKNDYYWVEGLHLPVENDPTFSKFHVGTLLDGELLYDTYPDGEQVLKYLVFDCLKLDGLDHIMTRPLDKRLGYFVQHIAKPFRLMCETFPQDAKLLPFMVEQKEFEFAYGISKMFGDTLRKLKHGNDGLIFTCRTTPYRFGTDPNILKWKPAEENTVDFRLSLSIPLAEPDPTDPNREPFPDYDAIPALNLEVNYGDKDYRPFAPLYVTPAQWDDLKALETPLDHRIVECYMDEQRRWRFMRFREDKKDANHISTVESVLESIQDAVSKEDLIAMEPAIKKAWKKRAGELPPKEKEGTDTQTAQATAPPQKRIKLEGQ